MKKKRPARLCSAAELVSALVVRSLVRSLFPLFHVAVGLPADLRVLPAKRRSLRRRRRGRFTMTHQMKHTRSHTWARRESNTLEREAALDWPRGERVFELLLAGLKGGHSGGGYGCSAGVSELPPHARMHIPGVYHARTHKEALLLGTW